MSLCQNCSRLVRPALYQLFEATLQELEASSINGCPVCKILSDGIRIFLPGEQPIRRFRISTGPNTDRLYLSDPDRCFVLECLVDEGVICPWGIFSNGVSSVGDTSSGASLSRAKNWIKMCVKRHKCGSISENPLPTRILDISGSNVRLIDSESGHGYYACLSHRWGNNAVIKTTEDNIEKNKVGIAWESLPKTFQDAITFVRRLGINMIWIDSLCIVQDNDVDWHRQANQMSSIYKRALVTVAATSSTGDSMGIFALSACQTVEHTAPSHRIIRVHFRNAIRHLGYPPAHEDNIAFPLLNRGWVYQERLLSPRIIHFGLDELFWECNQSSKCECGNTKFFNSTFQNPKVSHYLALGTQNSERCQKRWRNVVSEYSSLSLSKKSDRLIALAGIAEEYRISRGDHYFAGLWKSSITTDLMWYCNDIKQDDTHQKRAPSWSWASRDGQIRHIYSSESVEIQFSRVIELHCDQKDLTSISGSLIISGPYIRLPEKIRSLVTGKFLVELFRDCREVGEWLESGQLYGLLLARLESNHQEVSLVLRRCKDNLNKFERVGLLDVTPLPNSLWPCPQTEAGVGYENAEVATLEIV